MRMSFLAKAPLSLARATISSLATPLEPATGPGKMASNNRQNVTWVEVCTYTLAGHGRLLTVKGCSRSRFILGCRNTFMSGLGLQPLVTA
jgi:hypothetical protein